MHPSQQSCLLQVIARLPHLANLNASDITTYERKESELRYMRAILGELLGVCNDMQMHFSRSGKNNSRASILRPAGELSDLSSNQDAQARLRAMHPRLTELQAK